MKTEELEKYKGLYESAAETLKGFEGKDFDAIQKDRDEWKKKAEDVEKEYKEKTIDEFMKDITFSSEFAKRAFKEDLRKADLPVRDGKLFGASDFKDSYDKNAFADARTLEAEGILKRVWQNRSLNGT